MKLIKEIDEEIEIRVKVPYKERIPEFKKIISSSDARKNLYKSKAPQKIFLDIEEDSE